MEYAKSTWIQKDVVAIWEKSEANALERPCDFTKPSKPVQSIVEKISSSHKKKLDQKYFFCEMKNNFENFHFENFEKSLLKNIFS